MNIGKLSNLQNLEMTGVSYGAINAAVLNKLKDCSKLRVLELGDNQGRPDYSIPTAEVSRSVKLHTFTQSASYPLM